GGARVGAGIALFAGSDGDDQPAFGLERIVIQVVGFGDGLRSRVIGSGDRSQRFSALHLVITPPDALVGGNRGDRGLKLVRSSGRQVKLKFVTFSGNPWSSQPEQARVQIEQVRGGDIHALGR